MSNKTSRHEIMCPYCRRANLRLVTTVSMPLYYDSGELVGDPTKIEPATDLYGVIVEEYGCPDCRRLFDGDEILRFVETTDEATPSKPS